jgi:hypothetical protein
MAEALPKTAIAANNEVNFISSNLLVDEKVSSVTRFRTGAVMLAAEPQSAFWSLG